MEVARGVEVAGGEVGGVGERGGVARCAHGRAGEGLLGGAGADGPLASVGQRLMAPGVKMVANQFFRCMEGQVQNQAAGAERGA